MSFLDAMLIDTKDYVIDSQNINGGTFGLIYLATDKNNERVVIKKLIKNKEISITRFQKEFLREAQILFACRHPAIVGFRGFSMLNENFEFSPMIVLDYIKNGSLTDVIKNQLPGFNNTAKMKILYGISKGMEFLHAKKIMHRDLGTNNVLIDENFNPFITDFGSSKEITKDSDDKSIVGGTLYFAAPEVLVMGESSQKSDVFSFAMIMLNVIGGPIRFPFDFQNNYTFTTCIQAGQRAIINRGKIPEHFINLITKCWQAEENDRPEFSDIVRMFDEGLVLPDVTEEYQEYREIFSSAGKEEYDLAINLLNEQNYEDAIQFLEVSERAGYSPASIMLGKSYMKGIGVCRDQIEGFSHYLIAAQRNSIKGYVKVGHCYYFGFGTEQSFENAAEYYQKAANNNDARGFIGLGYCFLKNPKIKSKEKAFENFKRASDLGNIKSKYCLANCYQYGVGCDINLAECVKLLKCAASKGHRASIFLLFKFLKEGKGDIGLDAIEKYQPLADNGDSMAQFCMGEIYRYGIGCTIDPAKAFDYYQKSAKQRNSYGQYGLAECFCLGIGTEKEPKESFYYYKCATDQGNDIAAYRLGTTCYALGFGVAKNVEIGTKYYNFYKLSKIC